MAGRSAAKEEQGDEGEGFLNQLKNFTEGFMRLKTNKETMSKTISEHEKKIQELEIESEKKLTELKAIKEERRQLLNDLERSRFEVVKLNEQNVALSRELEKYKGSVKTPGRKAKGKDKGKEKEKRTGKDTQETPEKGVGPGDVLPPDLGSGSQLTETGQTEITTASDVTGAQVQTPAANQEQPANEGFPRTQEVNAWQALSTTDAQNLVAKPPDVATPQKKTLTAGKGMVIVYKTPDSHHSGYKTSVPLEVLQQEATKGKDIDQCRQVVESGVVDGNFESAGSINVVVEEYIGPEATVNTPVNEEIVNPESASSINVVVEEYTAPDIIVNATVNASVDEAVANRETEQNQETEQNMEIEQSQIEGNSRSDPQGVADKNVEGVSSKHNGASDSKESKGKSSADATPNTRTNRKTSKKSSKKKKTRKSMRSGTEVKNSLTENNVSTSEERNTDLNETQNESVVPQVTEKETFLSNMNLSSSKLKMRIHLRSSSQKEKVSYQTRSGRKRKATCLDSQVSEKDPSPETKLPDAEQENIPTDLKTPSRVKKEKFEKLITKTENQSDSIYNFDMEENDNCGDVPGPDIIVDPVTEDDFAGVYFCSACNIGFKTEAIFDRHILFRHSGAGLPNELPPSLQSQAGVQILQTDLKTPPTPAAMKNSSGTESMQPVDNEQTPLQNGSFTADGATNGSITPSPGTAEASSAKKSNFVIPKLKKEFPRPLLVVKKEKGPPILKREGSAEPQRKRYNTNLKRHACFMCDKKFASAVGLKAHVNKHNGVRPYECTICHMSFYAKSDRNKHVKITHNAVKSHFCLLCGKGFTTQVYLNHHIANHSQERKFGCDECGRRFKQKPHLDKHIQLIHRNERLHVCTTCGKAFGSTYGLKSHETTHSGVKMYSCDTCGKSFGNKSYLLKHQMYHTGEKKYMCIHCRKCFYLSTDLQRHMQIHTNEKAFACSECEYRTNMKANLKVHMLKHSGIKYTCSLCGKKLTSKGSLLKHSQLHEQVAMFEVTEPEPEQEPELEQEPEQEQEPDQEQELDQELEPEPDQEPESYTKLLPVSVDQAVITAQ